MVVDVEAFAIANAYQMNYPERTDPLSALIHVGSSVTVVCLLDRGEPIFTRDISIGGQVHLAALLKEFGPVGVDELAAKRMLHGQYPPDISADQVAGVLREASAQLVLEVRKTVDFYRATSPIDRLSRVVLSGGAWEAVGLVDLLASEFGAPVDVFDPFRRVQRIGRVVGRRRGRAGLRGGRRARDAEGRRPMIRVNLLAGGPGAAQPKVWIPAEQKLVPDRDSGCCSSPACSSAAGGTTSTMQRSIAEAGIGKAEGRIEQLKDAMKLLEAARTQKAELEERLAVIDRLRSAKHGPVRMLQLFNTALPDGLWLMEVKQSKAAVQIEGRALSQTAVSDFAKALQDSGFFKMPVEIVTTLMESVEETNVFRFVLKAEPAAGDPTAAATSPAPAPAAPNGKSGV